MFLTAPQSSHFRQERFHGLSPRENHFDWDLYYRFKARREQFWRDKLETDPPFRALAVEHFGAFQRAIDRTLGLLAGAPRPRVLDVGLSSEQLDRAILQKTGGQVVVLDVEQAAAELYERAFAGRGSFVLSDVIAFARDPANAGQFDLVYSAGLIEHFPDKADILEAHVRLARPGGLVLVFVPIDTPDSRARATLAAEWENFGYRELMTPADLRHVCLQPNLEILAEDAVGFFAAVWARKTRSD
jgi:SAM-dependent methyltransferase